MYLICSFLSIVFCLVSFCLVIVFSFSLMDSTHSLVAHFLQQKGYLATLEALENECGSALAPSKLHGETLEEIINDRVQYAELPEAVRKLELLNPDHDQHGINLKSWSTPYPKTGTLLEGVNSLVISSCFDEQKYVYLSTTDFTLHKIDIQEKSLVSNVRSLLGRVIIKKVVSFPQTLKGNHDRLLLIGMDGKGHIYNPTTETMEKSGELHNKFVIDCMYIEYNGKQYFASISRDFSLRVFTADLNQIALYKLEQIPTSFDYTILANNLVFVVGKDQHTLLDVVVFDGSALTLKYKMSVNDAEFTHSGFSPSTIAIAVIDNVPIVAVGTSHEPYMRLILLLLRNFATSEGIMRNQILKNLATLSPQDKFSQPLITWRRDGSGVWIMSEDGHIRGMDIVSQNTVVDLEAHRGKIKNFCVGPRFLITSGVDKDVKIWT